MTSNRHFLIWAVVFAVAAAAPWMLQDQGYGIRVLTLVLLFAAMGQSWNIVGGLANQISLGHAAFFGLGAYTSTLLLMRCGISPWARHLGGHGGRRRGGRPAQPAHHAPARPLLRVGDAGLRRGIAGHRQYLGVRHGRASRSVDPVFRRAGADAVQVQHSVLLPDAGRGRRRVRRVRADQPVAAGLPAARGEGRSAGRRGDRRGYGADPHTGRGDLGSPDGCLRRSMPSSSTSSIRIRCSRWSASRCGWR